MPKQESERKIIPYTDIPVSRRTVIVGPAIAVLLAALTPARRAAAFRGDPIRPEQFEADYHVKLATLHDLDPQQVAECWGQRCAPVPKYWPSDQLGILYQIAGGLPKEAFFPDVIVNPQIVLGLDTRAQEVDPEKQKWMEVDYRILNPEWKKVAMVRVAEALVDLNIPYREYILHGSKGRMIMKSDWFDRVYDILGGDFDSPPIHLREIANDRDPNTRFYPGEPNLDTGQTGSLSARLDFGINTLYPRVLIAKLAGEYLYGEANFKTGVGRFLPSEVDALYQFIKDDIFPSNLPD